jgi:peptide/nickel transport system permease protein
MARLAREDPGVAGARPGALRRFLRHRLAASGMILLALLVSACLLGPLALPARQLEPDLDARFLPPSPAHWLGTDDLGRDVVHRVLVGGRISLLVGLAGAFAATLLGTAVGTVAGMGGRIVDAVLMRITDAFLAVPLLPLMILLSATDPVGRVLDALGARGLRAHFDPSLASILLLVVAFGWMTTARLVRASLLVLKEMEFVLAARVLGASPLRVALVHLIPNALATILVAVTLAVGRVILYESVLSFLGLGVQPPVPTWGNMLTSAQESLWKAPWLAIVPGAFILATVVSVNFVGDGLRDALDPRARRG